MYNIMPSFVLGYIFYQGAQQTKARATANGEEDGQDSGVSHISEESLNILSADITKEEVGWAFTACAEGSDSWKGLHLSHFDVFCDTEPGVDNP